MLFIVYSLTLVNLALSNIVLIQCPYLLLKNVIIAHKDICMCWQKWRPFIERRWLLVSDRGTRCLGSCCRSSPLGAACYAGRNTMQQDRAIRKLIFANLKFNVCQPQNFEYFIATNCNLYIELGKSSIAVDNKILNQMF